LRHIDAAPPLLCVKGRTELLAAPGIGIVGARSASAAGRRFARDLAVELASAGLTIISGLARGIDTAAHEASLSRGTVAVLAGGLDVIYPPENANLHESIGNEGVLATEMTPGTIPKAEHFPRRNRIISGMSFGVIVVEAELRSGSLITARLANEQGREVFAVPGSPLDPRSAGPNKLIRDGATLITSAADVLEALGPVLSGQIPTLPEPFMAPISHFEDGEGLAETLRDRIISLLGPTPIEIDDLIRESGAGAAAVMTVLLELELAGRLSRHGRQRVSLNPGG
jgi:DNA processing protein